MAKAEACRSKPVAREREPNKKRLTQQGFRESSQEGVKRSEELSLEGGLNKTTKQDGADTDTFRSGGRRLKVISTYSVKVEAEQET